MTERLAHCADLAADLSGHVECSSGDELIDALASALAGALTRKIDMAEPSSSLLIEQQDFDSEIFGRPVYRLTIRSGRGALTNPDVGSKVAGAGSGLGEGGHRPLFLPRRRIG